MLAATVLMLLMVASRYFEVADLDDRPLSLLFRGAMLIAHLTAIAAVAMLPLVALILLWPKPSVAIPLGILLASLLLIGLLIDTQVYQLYRFHINAGVLNLIFGGAARATFFFSQRVYLQAALIAAAVIVSVAVLGLWIWRMIRDRSLAPGVLRALASLALVSLATFHVGHIWADATDYEPILEQTDVLPLRYAATAKRALHASGLDLRELRQAQRFDKSDGEQLTYPLQTLKCHPRVEPPNIVVIMIDSWRFDEMNAAVTPNIAALARDSARFMNHYSGGNATRIGVFSFFYSIPGTYWHRMLAERRGPVFMDELKRLDYDVQVFRSAPLHSPEFDRTVFAQIDSPRARSDGNSPAEWDRDLTDDFVRYVDERASDRPFFAFLFYDAPHAFDHPDDYPSVFRPAARDVNYLDLGRDSDPELLRNLYRNSVHYVDSLVGEALALLRKRGLLDDSIVIVSGDHGQEFNDNGQNYWGHASNFTRFQTAVPLLVHAPGLEPKVYDHRTTHFDVIPTVMHRYLGCTNAFSTYSVGRSLLEPGGRETLVLSEYAEFAIMHANRMAVVRQHGMEIRDENHVEIDSHYSTEAIKVALEQKTRFAAGAKRRN